MSEASKSISWACERKPSVSECFFVGVRMGSGERHDFMMDGSVCSDPVRLAVGVCLRHDVTEKGRDFALHVDGYKASVQVFRPRFFTVDIVFADLNLSACERKALRLVLSDLERRAEEGDLSEMKFRPDTEMIANVLTS